MLAGLWLAASSFAYANLTDAKRAYSSGDFTQAVSLLRPLVSGGNKEAQYLLARMYEQGDGVEADVDEATRLYRLSADQGHPLAEQRLAQLENNAAGQESVVIEWYLPAAEEGDTEAQYNLAYMYETGWGVSVNEPEAARWYQEAADMQHDLSQLRLGLMYIVAAGVDKDREHGVELVRSAAENGNPVAEALVQELFDAEDVEQLNVEKIVRGLRRMLDGSQDEVITALQDSLESARAGQAQPAPVVARAKLEKAAQAAPQAPSAEEKSTSKAKVKVAKVLNLGLGGSGREGNAAQLYRESANKGDAEAQFNLGMLYMQGRGVDKDAREGRRWIKLAADQSYKPARQYLELWTGELDALGLDGTIALSWLMDAARNGDMAALYEMGFLFEQGRGVKKNPAEAMKWYALAADQGIEDARKRFALLQQGGADMQATVGKVRASVEEKKQVGAEQGASVWNMVGIGLVSLLMLASAAYFYLRIRQQERQQPGFPSVSPPAKAPAGEEESPPGDMEFLKELWKEEPPKPAAPAPQPQPQAEPAEPQAKPAAQAAEPQQKAEPAVPPAAEPQPAAKRPAQQESPAPRAETQVQPEVAARPQAEAEKDDTDRLLDALSESPSQLDSTFVVADELDRKGISRDALASRRISADSLFEEGVVIDKAGKVVRQFDGMSRKLNADDLLDVNEAGSQKSRGITPTEFENLTLESEQLFNDTEPAEQEPAQPEATRAARPSGVVKPMPSIVEMEKPSLSDEDERSLAEVHYNIGLMFSRGDGVPKNDLLAAKWYEKAAQEGLPEAQMSLSNMYMEGCGVKQDAEKARHWLEKAAANGYEPAQELLARRNQAS